MSAYKNGWCVKITGLSPDTTTSDLSNQFEVPTQRINIPGSQTHSSKWYALIDGFESEKQAVRFVSQWNEIFRDARINIRCELDAPMVEESSSKRNISCRHGDECHSAQCPYKHSSRWRVCREGANCKEFDCTAIHPPSRKAKCKHESNCRNQNSGCSYLHPNRRRRSPSPQQQQQQQQQHFKSVKTRNTERRSAQIPIFASYTEFSERLLKEKILIVVADSNSGRSTQLPQYAAECCRGGLVVCTQPRAITAMALACRVADEYDGTLEGHSVGYRVGNGHDRVTGTDIMFMTDTALIYEYQMDTNLSNVRALIVDEVHERSLHTDIVLGIAKLLLNKRRDDFFVVISLTTKDPSPYLKFFERPSASLLQIENHLHSIAVDHLPSPADCPEYKLVESHVLPTLLRFYPKHAKHTLVFLPSQREIEKALEMFTKRIPDECVVFPLYGSLSVEEQEKILNFDKKHSEKRMIIFCTNVAETSLPIRNVQLVIDTGLVRQLRFDKQLDMNILETVRISRFSADKRRDIVAYSKRGHCIRLYNEDDLKTEEIEPEIVHSSLDLVLLQLKRLHLDPQTFPFITKPDSVSINTSLNLLENLTCLDKDKKMTRRGELFAELSVDPRLSALMVDVYTEREDGQRLLSLMATLAAILSAPGSLFSTSNTNNNAITSGNDEYNSDLLSLCRVFDEWKSIGTINQATNKCITCRKVSQHRSTICHSCRAQHSMMNGLNHQVLQLIESSIDFYVKTIIDARWKLTLGDAKANKSSTDGEIIGQYLRKRFPAQVGHLLVPHLPDEGVRLIKNDLRASIANRSIYVQRAHDRTHLYFVAMSITRSPSGRYVVDRLHQISAHDLPASTIEKLLVRENVGGSTSNEVRAALNAARAETWTKWLVQEYDRVSRQLAIWGLAADRSRLESTLQPILTSTHAKAIECGSIRATFQNGLICTAIEILENALRLNLQRVPCKTYKKLQVWFRTKLNISHQDIRENNFLESSSKSSDDDDDDDDDNYEATPFYIVLKSTEAFQRATAKLPAHYICPQEALSSSTTGTHMSEKDAWGRQLVLTIPIGGSYITAKELLDRLTPQAVDCRQFGKRSIRTQPGIQLTNLPRETDETFIRQLLQPINLLKVSLRQTHKDGTGSSSAHIFFADNPQRQQAIAKLQSDLCQKPVTITVRSRTNHQLIPKQIVPTVTEMKTIDPIPLTFLITSINRQTAFQLYKEIIPKMNSSWQIDSSATVTVTHPHLYPDFDNFVQKIASQFETQVQQQLVDPKQVNGRSPIRCFFNHGTPQKTALAATMLAQATAPIIIKMTSERQKQLFDELFSTRKIYEWAKELKLEVTKKERSVIWIEIRGPQVEQGQLMRQIADYSDTFDVRFRILELNSAVANFFGRKKQADAQLQVLADTWSNWGCYVKYVSKTRSITLYAEPTTKLSFLDSCENEVKQMLSKLSVDGNITRIQQTCVFCSKKSYSTNTLTLCGHAYCRCASTHLTNTMPLQCHEPTCKMNIDVQDLFQIFSEHEELVQVCKKSIQIYLEKNASAYDQRFCPNPVCDGLVKQSSGYQTCLTCGRSVCPSCALVDDDSHQGRTCAERKMFQSMGEFLPDLFKAAEKFARDSWAPSTPPIIRVDYNMALGDTCLSMKRFFKGAEALSIPAPPDMARGFFAFHGTAPTGMKPICTDGFDPKRRAGQAYGPGEYFGVTSAVSHGYSQRGNTTGPYSMIIAFLLNCPQLSTRAGFCHVMNNPIDWSHAFNLPVVAVSYGTQASCNSPLS